jgi:hypothetical protein
MDRDERLVGRQILPHPEERETLKDEAERLGISMNKVVRRAFRALREEQDEYDAALRENDPFFKIIGIAKGFDDDFAEAGLEVVAARD